MHPQDETQRESLSSPAEFWGRQAQELHWHRPPSSILELSGSKLNDPQGRKRWTWFRGGEISTCYNCLDRHIEAKRGDAVAIAYDSPVTRTKRNYTYREVLQEVETLAGVLREEGVNRGDVVLIYMPMIPQALFACLAVSRLGAIHAVVFGGFAAPALAQRIEQCRPRLVLTCSCGIEGGKAPIAYAPLVQDALRLAGNENRPERVIVWQRPECPWTDMKTAEGEKEWHVLMDSAKKRGVKAEAVPVGSQDVIYLIYTSGTTGLPKGVVRQAGGHAVALNLSMRYMLDIKPGDVNFCASDIGWVPGHSYLLYGPLLAGATTVLFEGKPIGTPDAGTFWRIIREHRVNSFFVAPTALRAIRLQDPDNRFFKAVGATGGLRTLRHMFLAGERSEPQVVQTYQDLLTEYAALNATVVDNWWSSESGLPISGIASVPSAGLDFHSTDRTTPLPIKIGSAGKAMPGWDVRVVDDSGKEVSAGTMGNIVLGWPLAPSGFTTLWQDDERFFRGYLRRFEGRWIDTGDAGMIDPQGYIHVMSRSDDIINVAAHRFSTGAIEQAIASHPSVAECCVVGMPDELKGQMPFAFITLSGSSSGVGTQLVNEIQARVRAQIGAIAAIGGLVHGAGIIPRTRSGKTLRRVLRQLVENAAGGDFTSDVAVPATIEDPAAVEAARGKVREYFSKSKAKL